MTKAILKYFDMLSAKKAYANGENITALLRRQKHVEANTSEIIEVAYDLQAGTYVEHVEHNITQATLYAAELAAIVARFMTENDTLLDVGTGEMTTLSLLAGCLAQKPRRIYAFDISWSRLYKGMAFAQRHMGAAYKQLVPFVADIREIPLLDKSVSITTSSHALEPNGGALSELMSELFRVTVEKLVLFEPCYEINSEEGQQRMDRLGYIKDIDGVVEKLGGTVVEKIRIKNISNPLNPTVCFVITPPKKQGEEVTNERKPAIFSVPGTDYPLRKVDEFYFSDETGLCFPVLKTIPVLKSNTAILASSLLD
jgi:ubiquinone/menaquinone biosynthesis C-methylase UbiE